MPPAAAMQIERWGEARPALGPVCVSLQETAATLPILTDPAAQTVVSLLLQEPNRQGLGHEARPTSPPIKWHSVADALALAGDAGDGADESNGRSSGVGWHRI